VRSLGTLAAAGLCFGICVPTPAWAHFGRTPLRKLPNTVAGPIVAGGIAVDGENDVWVANREDSFAEFAPVETGESELIETLEEGGAHEQLDHLAIAFPSEAFFVVGRASQGGGSVEVYDRAGAKIREWGAFSRPSLAVDDAPDTALDDPSHCGALPLAPGECFVYVATEGESGGIGRFNEKGEEEPFSFAGDCGEGPECYVEKNEIRGLPGRPKGIFGSAGLPGVAVDAKGDIYAANAEMQTVDEYLASGKFVRAFELQGDDVPRFHGALGGSIAGVAVDQASDHVIVPVTVATPEGPFGALDEFDAETGAFVAQVTGVPAGGHLHRPSQIAVDMQGNLYVVDSSEDGSGERPVYVYERGHFLPTVSLGTADARKATSATLTGTVNPEGFELTSCQFEYVELAKFEKEGFAHPKTVGCDPTFSAIPGDSHSHSVTAMIGGLEAGVSYRYRLMARSAGELGGTSVTGTHTFTSPAVPEIESVSSSHASSAFIDLDAVIDPHGVHTTYHFEFLTAAAYREDGESFGGPQPAAAAPSPDGAVGSGGATGNEPEGVTVHLDGLSPGSEYRYRVVASSECEALDNPGHQCVSAGGVESFTTLAAPEAGLPDGRAYELVTPANKEGGSDMFAEEETNGEFYNQHSTGTPSLDGDGFILSTFSSFGEFPFAGENAYVFRRNATGWANTSLASPSMGVQVVASGVGLLFDPNDLSRVGFQDTIGSVLSSEGEYHVALVGRPGAPNPACPEPGGIEDALAGECYLMLRKDPHRHLGEEKIESFVVGGSQDLSHIILDIDAKGACSSTATSLKVTTGDVLCEWDGDVERLEDGEARPALKLINLAPGSETAPTSACGAQLGGVSSITRGPAFRAVSADGTRIFFTSPQTVGRENGMPAGKGCWNGGTLNAPQLYMRAGGETVQVSAPEPGVADPSGQHVAEYAGASKDGSKVFFETSTELTKEAETLGVHDRELYEYDVASKELKWISSGETGKDAGSVYAVTAVAADGSDVYFLANGVLAGNPGANGSHAAPGNCSGVPGGPGVGGKCALYRYAGGVTRYIATVNELAFSEVEEHAPHAGSDSDWYTTPDGRYLLFKSNLALTHFSNADSRCLIRASGGGTSGPCSELYRYSVEAAERGEEEIVCVSCGADGDEPTGNAEFDRSGTEGPNQGPVVGMSDDGKYVFFDTPTRLVPQAENHTLAVYEWHEGHGISLLSSPNDPFPSFFLGYSPYYTPSGEKVEGGNVFIGTHAQLIPHEGNAVANIYDARICVTESPCISPAAGPAAQCEGGACQAPAGPSSAVTPGSMTFSGHGNPLPPATTVPAPHSKAQSKTTNAQKLAKALRACRKDRAKHKRKVCESNARKRYAPAKKAGQR
jgi:hypothetical protein